jgi:cobalt-zinc-cadmium efflux system outer membrane protein
MRLCNVFRLVCCALCACSVSHGTQEVRTTVAERIGHPVAIERSAEQDASAQKLLAAPLDAERAVAVAMLQNPRLRAALAELGIARAEVVAHSRIDNPEVDASMRFLPHADRPEYDLLATENLTSLILWPLERGAANAEFEAAKLDAARAAIDLAFVVRRAFYAYQASVQLEALVRMDWQAADAAAALATGLRAAGNITQLDHDTQRALAEELRTGLMQSSAEVVADRERLSALLGATSGEAAAWKLAGGLPGPSAAEPQLAVLEQRALQRNLELRALATRQGAASREHDAAQLRGLVPQLRAGISLERRIDEPWGVGPAVGLRLPIFDQGQGATARAEAKQERAAALHEAVELEARAAARAVSTQLSAARSAVERYRDVLLPLWASILEQTQRQYNAMETGVFQLVQAKRAQLSVQQRYVLALRDYWLQRSAAEQLIAGSLPPSFTAAALRGAGEPAVTDATIGGE